MWEWAGARTLLIVYPLGLMKRCSADFYTFQQFALFLEARRPKSAEFSASLTEADAMSEHVTHRLVQIISLFLTNP